MNINNKNSKKSQGIVTNRKKIFEQNELNNTTNKYNTKIKPIPNKLSKKRISYFETSSVETIERSQKPVPAKLDPSKLNFQNESSSIKNEINTYTPSKIIPHFETPSIEKVKPSQKTMPAKLDPSKLSFQNESSNIKNEINTYMPNKRITHFEKPSSKTIAPSPAKLDTTKTNLIQNSEISGINKEKQAKFQTWLKSTHVNEIIKKITLEMYANKKTTLDKISLYYGNISQKELSSVELDKLNKLRNKYPKLKLPNIEDTIAKQNQYVIDLIEKSSDPQVVLDEIGRHVSNDHGYYIGDTSLLKHLTSHYNNKEQLTDTVAQNLLAIRKNFPEFKLNDTINSELDLKSLNIPSFDESLNNKLPIINTDNDPTKLVATPISFIALKTMPPNHFSIKGTFKKYLFHNKLTSFINKLVIKSLNWTKHTQIYIHTNNKNTKKHTKDNTKTLSK